MFSELYLLGKNGLIGSSLLRELNRKSLLYCALDRSEWKSLPNGSLVINAADVPSLPSKDLTKAKESAYRYIDNLEVLGHSSHMIYFSSILRFQKSSLELTSDSKKTVSSAYAYYKSLVEDYLHERGNSTIFWLTHLYGECMKRGAVNDMITEYRLSGRIRNRRSFISTWTNIKDVAIEAVHRASNNLLGHDIISSGEIYDLQDIVHIANGHCIVTQAAMGTGYICPRTVSQPTESLLTFFLKNARSFR